MRTASTTPLVCASPPSPSFARKPVSKRRRLNHATDPGCEPGRTMLTDSSNATPTPQTLALALSVCAKLSCSTCHRALSTAAIRPGVAGPSVCSRCAAPTCAICARTCTSYTCPSSIPPTPALTRSPSPAAPASPKRIALGLCHAAMNCDVSAALRSSAKRKKAPVDKEGGDGDDDNGGNGNSSGNGNGNGNDGGDNAGRDHPDVVWGGVRDGAESVVIPGCGRVVCRACCVESVSNDGQLCVDCFALV